MVSLSEQISQESGEKKDVFRNHYKPWIESSRRNQKRRNRAG